jgi:hypothetical protein
LKKTSDDKKMILNIYAEIKENGDNLSSGEK